MNELIDLGEILFYVLWMPVNLALHGPLSPRRHITVGIELFSIFHAFNDLAERRFLVNKSQWSNDHEITKSSNMRAASFEAYSNSA